MTENEGNEVEGDWVGLCEIESVGECEGANSCQIAQRSPDNRCGNSLQKHSDPDGEHFPIQEQVSSIMFGVQKVGEDGNRVTGEVGVKVGVWEMEHGGEVSSEMNKHTPLRIRNIIL